MIKPVTMTDLREAIGKALGVWRTSGAAISALVAAPDESARRRILLAEDNPVNQAFALGILEQWGHDVQLAVDGREALDFLKRETFDVVLMDVQMPNLDGMAATNTQRERETITGDRVPIVAMTAHAMQGDRERCLAAGMDDYISKPIRAAELRELLQKYPSRSARGARGNTAVPTPGLTEVSTLDIPAHVDVPLLLKQVGGDRDLAVTLIHALLSFLPNGMNTLSTAYRERDASALERAAHSLRGPLGQLSAMAAFERAATVEELARELNLDAIGPAITALESEVEALTPELRRLGNATTLAELSA
jgi:CheY-like chemotaxis protein/HPt (histidine-containing phosphotransfer) domain-containing protein